MKFIYEKLSISSYDLNTFNYKHSLNKMRNFNFVIEKKTDKIINFNINMHAFLDELLVFF